MTQLTEMAMNEVYATTLCELMAENPDIICLEADLSKASGTYSTVRKQYPDRFIDCGVAEANMVCISAGLAREGKIPFCASFTCFASRRVYDQVTISVAYANNNVKIIGTGPGITQGANGGTHMCFQDLAIMRAMPNLHVYSPCDVYELKSMVRYMARNSQPTYMQLLRSKMQKIFDEYYSFDPERASVVKEGRDVTLVSTGYMTEFSYDVARELEDENISIELIHYSSVKPFDVETLVESAKKTGAVVTVENQNIIGGLGTAACEALSENFPCRVRRLGVPDRFGEVATEKYLFDKHGFGPKHIADACREMSGR